MDFMEFVKGLDIDAAVKTELTKKAGEFKTEVNNDNKLAREKLELELQTEKKTVTTLTGEITNLNKTIESTPDNEEKANKTILEMQLKLDEAKTKLSDKESEIETYTKKDFQSKMDNFCDEQLKNVEFTMKQKHVREEYTAGLIPNASGGFLGKDDNGNEILHEKYTELFLGKNKDYIKAAGSNSGGSGENTGSGAVPNGLPATKEAYHALNKDQKLDLKVNHTEHVRGLLTS